MISNSRSEPEWVLEERLQALSAIDNFIEEDKSQKLANDLTFLFEKTKSIKGAKKEILEHENIGFLSLGEILNSNKSEFYQEIFLNRFNHSFRNPQMAFLNAFFTDCTFYFVDDNTNAQIAIDSLSGLSLNFFILGNDLDFDLINSVSGLTMQSNELYTGENCNVNSLIYQDNCKQSFVSQVNLINNFSTVHANACWFGGGSGEIYNKLIGTNANGYDLEIFVADADNKLQLNSVLEHAQLGTKGNIHIKGIGKDVSSSKSNGMIKINKNAPKSESFLDQHVILLGPNAISEANPDLEVENNDVSSRHAATVSMLDEDKLFYLKSRGIEEDLAKDLLVRGFLESAVRKIKSEHMQDYVLAVLESKLQTQ